MATDLITTDRPATASLTPALLASAKTVLDRAFDCTAVFTAAEIALIEPIAAAVPAMQPVDERTLRQSLGTLSGAMPSQATDESAGKLKLGAYLTMLAGYDQRAVAYACRRCLADLDWFPTVHQIIERANGWVSPERSAIARATAIMRAGRRAAKDDGETVTPEDMRALREQADAAARALRDPRPRAVAWTPDRPADPTALRIPNAGDYERVFGIDVASIAAREEAARLAAEEADTDLLADAVRMHRQLYARAA